MDARELYGLPLERFTGERNALATRLRSEGRRDEAAEVASLRKPSVAAWAVNQLVRTQRRQVEALFKAGDALQTAQADVLAGRGDAGSLRRTANAERAAVDSLTEKAHGLLSSEGHELTPAKLEQVSETLHAAAIDAETRDAVRDGCLVRELRHVGLGALAPGAAPRRRSTPKGRSSADRPSGRLKAARDAEAAARREMERAQGSAREAARRRNRAADQLREAEEALAGARQHAEEATRRHERARRELEEL